MDIFSIAQLSQFSGIKAHTIRIWEKRYNALSPNRSAGNTRYYNNDQLRRLLNIVSLSESGYKVSELCVMPDKKLFAAIKDIHENNSSTHQTEYFISQLLFAGINYDEIHFEKLLSDSFITYGIKDAYLKVVCPMLHRIGIMWSKDDLPVVSEHFISNLIRQKFFSAINSLPPANNVSDTWLLFLPENEFHEIGLLFSYFLIRQSGRKVIYLGANVPVQSIATAVKEVNIKNLLFFIVHKDLPENIDVFCNQLSKFSKGRSIYMAANQQVINQLKGAEKKRIKFLPSIETLENELS